MLFVKSNENLFCALNASLWNLIEIHSTVCILYLHWDDSGFLQCFHAVNKNSSQQNRQAQCTCCDEPLPQHNCASALYYIHSRHWEHDLKWCSQLIELLQSPMKPVRKEITKTEWAVCQLYPPSKRTFGASYWVAPEQKWTSLDSEVILSTVIPCDLPQWGR